MKAYINSHNNANFVNVSVEDAEKAIATAKEEGCNQISIPVFIRSGKGAEGLHGVDAIAATMGVSKVFLCSGDISVRKYEPRSGSTVKVD